MTLVCRKLLKLPIDSTCTPLVDYVKTRRRANGSFHNTPASDTTTGHVVNTYWGLRALQAAEAIHEEPESLIDWLQRCQTDVGGFQWSPEPTHATAPDVYFTWCGVRALALLGSRPHDGSACIAWLQTLGNTDGGCGARPGWLSNPLATYYALDCLSLLQPTSESSGVGIHTKPTYTPNSITEKIDKSMKVFSAQLEAHGTGSPAEAVAMARNAKVHLWGAKNAQPEWLKAAQGIAEKHNNEVGFFCANEEYGTFFQLPGFGTYSHLSDVCFPANTSAGESLAKASPVTWESFRRQRLAPLQKVGGQIYWQFNENECLTRFLLDDSLQRGGYAAIASFHFGNPDFTNSEPFLMQYRGQLPYVALLDAHGPEAWWFGDQFWGMRTLFFAHEPSYDSFVAALKRQHVVAVRHDDVSQQQTWMHGSPAALAFAREQEPSWRWWDPSEITRPWASIAILNANDPFEAGSPEHGWSVRVRGRAENTTQGKVKRMLVKLVELRCNEEAVSFEEVRRGERAPWNDRYWIHPCETRPKTVTAVLERVDTQERLTVTASG